jgi:hypothetical protein
VAQRQVAPRLVDLTIMSPALGRAAKVRLLTPDGWGSRRRAQRWPVLYLLHGCCDTYDSWTRETDVDRLRRPSDDRLLRPGHPRLAVLGARASALAVAAAVRCPDHEYQRILGIGSGWWRTGAPERWSVRRRVPRAV